MTVFTASDGYPSIRSLTYGEIADALTTCPEQGIGDHDCVEHEPA